MVMLSALWRSADAATFVHSVNVGPANATLGWTNTVLLPQFDSGLGTLISVTLRYYGNINGDLGVENIDDKFDLITGTLAGFFNIYDASNNLQVALSLNRSDNFVADPFDGDLDYGGTSGYTFSLSTNGQQATVYTDPPLDLSPFIGLGNLTYTVVAGNNSIATAGAGTPIWYSLLNSGGTLEITYETSVVPEPGALLRWSGLIGLCLAIRRQNRRVSR